MGVASLPFGALLYGMYRGKYNYKVLRYNLEFKDLPEAFHNYTITQISDILYYRWVIVTKFLP